MDPASGEAVQQGATAASVAGLIEQQQQQYQVGNTLQQQHDVQSVHRQPSNSTSRLHLPQQQLQQKQQLHQRIQPHQVAAQQKHHDVQYVEVFGEEVYGVTDEKQKKESEDKSCSGPEEGIFQQKPPKSSQKRQQDFPRQGSSSRKQPLSPLDSDVGNDFNKTGHSNDRQGDQRPISDNNCPSKPKPLNQRSQVLDTPWLPQQQQESKELSGDDKILKNGQLLNAIRKNKTSEEKFKKVQKHLDKGADVNTTDANDRNNTPLHIAVLKGEPTIIELLLKRGAIVDKKNAANKTPLDIAKLPNTPNGQEIVNIIGTYLGSILQLSNQQASVEQSSGQLSAQQQPQQKQTTENSKRNKDEKYQCVYSKRCGTTGISGQLYETKLLGLLLLRALNDEEIVRFYIGTNVDGVGAFDDIIFRYDIKHEHETKTRVIFIQAKHRDNPDKDKITVEKVLKKDGDLSLLKYFDSYLSIIQKFNPKSKDIVFKGEFKSVDCDFVIFTPGAKKFSRGKDLKEHHTSKSNLIQTNQAGKTFQFKYEDGDINLLVKTASELRIKLLAENLAEFILSSKNHYSNMMSDKLIKSYHVVLAQQVIKVSDIKPGNYREGEFLPTFFDSNENLLSILRETLYRKIVLTHYKQSTLQPEEIMSLVNEILKNPSADAISKLMGSTLVFDAESSTLKFIKNETSQEITKLKGDLEEKKVRKEIVEEAIAIAGKKKLKSLKFFRLPSAFGNLDFKVKEKRLEHLVSKFIELLENDGVASNYVVKIDDDMVGHGKMLTDGDMAINGGIGGLAGNLLILDERTRILKFNKDEGSLPANAKQLYKKLKDKISEDKLNRCRFEINFSGFPRLSLVDEKYDKSLLEDFLSKLRFYTNQAKEDEVEKILKEEIDRHYVHKKQDELLFRVKSDAIFLQFHDEIQKWWKQPKQAPYLTKSCKFLDQAKKDIIETPLLTILNFMYSHTVKRNGIEFTQDAIETLELGKFIAASDGRVLNIITNENILSDIKLVQYFENRDSNNHSFMDLGYVLRTGFYKRVISEFNEATQDILIIGCKEHSSDGNINMKELYRELKGKSSKKIILVTEENSILAENFKQDFNGKYIREDKMNSLVDLTYESQIKLLENSKVIFQGEDVTLGVLIDENLKHLIDNEVLSKLIKNEKIEIGRPLRNSKYEEVKDYYICRNFNRYIKMKNEFRVNEQIVDEQQLKKLNLFVTYSSQVRESNLHGNQDVVLISNAGEDFKGLCDKFKDRNIHWFEKVNNEFIWQKSQGNLKKLRECVDRSEQSTYSFEPKTIKDVDENVAIIAAEPGMGKSTVLAHLAVETKKSDPLLWIVRINLLDYSTEFERLKKGKIKFDTIDAIKFLYRTVLFTFFKESNEEGVRKQKKIIDSFLSCITIKDDKISLEGHKEVTKGLKLLEIELFNNFYNQGEIALLFDGFDEISPDYKDIVFGLLKVLRDAKAGRVWVTTRPYGFLLGQLEVVLDTFSYTLEPFSPQNQKNFLERFWKKDLELSQLDSNRFNSFTNELLERFSQSIDIVEFQSPFKTFYKSIDKQQSEFMSIPLQTYMIAKIFQSLFKEFYNSEDQELSNNCKQKLSEELNLGTLYEYFIDIKFFEIRFGEKKAGMHNADPDMKRVIKKECEKFVEDHRKLAVYAILEKDALAELLSKDEISEAQSLIEIIKQGREKTGIIIRIIDGKPHFIHRTFAEYFTASYFWVKFKSIQFNNFKGVFIKILTERVSLQTCKFFQLIAEKDLKNNINFPDRKLKVEILLKNLVFKIRKYDSSEFNKPSIKFLLGLVEFFMSRQEKDDLGIITDVLQGIEDDRKLSLLCVCAEMGYIKLADTIRSVASGQLTMQFLQNDLKHNKWYYTPLWLAAKNSHLDFVKTILVENLSYETTWEDKDRKNLRQRILETETFEVLRSCLKLDIVNGNYTFRYGIGELTSLLVYCIREHAPSDVIELLIEKTDIDFINRLKIGDLPAVVHVIGYLIHYDKIFINSLVEKGIDLNAGYKNGTTLLNVVCFEFLYSSFSVPQYIEGTPRFFRYFFYSDKEFSKFFNLVKSLLEYGAIDNSECDKGDALQLVKQTYYIHKLFEAVFKTANEENDTVSDLLDKISDKVLQLMIKSPSIQYSDHFRGYEISVDLNLNKITFSPNYLIFECRSDFEILSRAPREKISFLPEHIQSLLFQTYKIDDTEGTVIRDTLNELSVHTKKFRERLVKLKRHGFTVSDILERFKSVNCSVMSLLKRVMELYINQNYEIDDALTEVSEETSKFSERIQSCVKNFPTIGKLQTTVYDTDKILNILGIKDSNIEEDLMSKINESNGIGFLNKVLLELNNVGQKNKIEVLKSMIKFSEQSSETFKLLKIINDLFDAIKTRSKESIVSILEKVELSCRRAVVNARNEQRKTLLDLAYEEGCDHEVTILLHAYGAKFNNYFDYSELFSGSQVQSFLSN